jgi:hypothetical protein
MEQKEEKNEEKKEEETTSSSFSLMFGKQKLTKAQKKYIKYRKSLKLIKNKNIRANIVYLYELTKNNNKELKNKYAIDKSTIGQRKFKYFTDWYNKIREIINSEDINYINNYVFEEDKILYKLDNKEDNQSKTNEEEKKSKLNEDDKKSK